MKSNTGEGALRSGLVFCFFLSVATYPFPDLRFAVGAVEFPVAGVFVLLLLPVLLRQVVVGKIGRVLSRSLIGLWLMAVGSVGALLIAYFWDRPGDLTLTFELLGFATIPAILVATLRTERGLGFAVAGFLIGTSYLVIYGLNKFVTESQPWVELQYGEATRNGDAMMLSGCFALSIGLLTGLLSRRRFSLVGISLFSLLALLSATAVSLSLSRSAWIGSLAAVIYCVLCLKGPSNDPHRSSRRSSRYAYMGASFLGLGILILPNLIAEPEFKQIETRVQSFYDTSTLGNSNVERAALLESAWDAAPLWGWTGAGVGEFSQTIAGSNLRLEHGHNILITTWLETGIVGLAGLLVILSQIVRFARRARRQPPVVVASAALCVSWVLNGMFEGSSSSIFFWGALGLGCGCLASIERQAKSALVPSENREVSRRQGRQGVLAVREVG